MGNFIKAKINELLIGSNTKKLNDNIETYNILDVSDKESFFFGTIDDCIKLNHWYLKDNGKRFSYFDLCISDWLPFVKEEYVNIDGYFKQVHQLNQNDIGMFCALDSNDKFWDGKNINSIDDIKSIKQELYEEDRLLYLSPIKEITNEFRFWIINGEIVEYSEFYNCFTNSKRVENLNTQDVIDYANKIIHQYYEPGLMYTIDVGYDLSSKSLKVIEYNCFSCSNFFKADINKIVNSIPQK